MQRHHRTSPPMFVLAASLTLLAACSSSNSTAPGANAAAIVAVSASNVLVGTVGQDLATPVSIKVVDASGAPVAGAMVSWAIESGGGSISITSLPTDSLGIASVDWTLGTVAGTDSLKASVNGLTSLVLGATANPDAVASLVKVSGDGQTIASGSTAQFVVKAVDQYGNAVPGVPVTWMAETGGVLGTTTTVTGIDGIAQNTLAPDQSTTYDVLAEVQNDAAIETQFTASTA
ncbi:MAG: Ig-like domain-containing protein [bacterium]